ncbi:hypothetical protein GQ44DRAFT_714196 [Phaeosphaeriaceae sp. PMI808]|nr:hypothetical protein GQ44DRAFT_714196 [Phaeosphaeriaceae sp. PMI808]
MSSSNSSTSTSVSNCFTCIYAKSKGEEKCYSCLHPAKKGFLKAPWNARIVQHVPIVLSNFLSQLYHQYNGNFTAIAKEVKRVSDRDSNSDSSDDSDTDTEAEEETSDKIGAGSEDGSQKPLQNQAIGATTTVPVCPEYPPTNTPSITLTGPENELPTMDLDTWCKHGDLIRKSELVQVSISPLGRKPSKGCDKKEKDRWWGMNAWANALFRNAVKDTEVVKAMRILDKVEGDSEN